MSGTCYAWSVWNYAGPEVSLLWIQCWSWGEPVMDSVLVLKWACYGLLCGELPGVSVWNNAGLEVSRHGRREVKILEGTNGIIESL